MVIGPSCFITVCVFLKIVSCGVISQLTWRKSPAGIPKLPSNSFGFFWSKKEALSLLKAEKAKSRRGKRGRAICFLDFDYLNIYPAGEILLCSAKTVEGGRWRGHVALAIRRLIREEKEKHAYWLTLGQIKANRREQQNAPRLTLWVGWRESFPWWFHEKGGSLGDRLWGTVGISPWRQSGMMFRGEGRMRAQVWT